MNGFEDQLRIAMRAYGEQAAASYVSLERQVVTRPAADDLAFELARLRNVLRTIAAQTDPEWARELARREVEERGS